MGLENNALQCIGPAKPTKIANTTAVAGNQVWWSATNTSGTFQWGWRSPDEVTYTALGVKHRQLQTEERLMFLARPGGIEVLSYWYLSPRLTPATLHPPRIVSFGNGTRGPSGTISALSSLDAGGGVYAAEQGRIWWIPVVRPLTAFPPDNANATMIAQLGGVIQAIWTVENTQTLYVAEWFNSSNNIRKYTISNRALQNPKTAPLIAINSTVYPNPPTDRPVISCILSHPRTQDVYVGMYGAGGILIYDSKGDMKAQVMTTFINVLSMEIDNDGTMLYISGDDGAGSGSLDSLNLKLLGLSDRSIAELATSDGAKFSSLNVLLLISLAAMGILYLG
ncbi:hypothetical protein PhCBS80983_g01476 [Powellomyces hirtus]|uniref:Uncharacterized protein n=1 Tax=Powellomyces hirtus TaxID=109895 RepID=A0A507EA47_9FUNG|nr:hypothetical protein PhCBS80983_g01476 [Powellomyces hirtus]